MQVSGATDLASKGPSVSDSCIVKVKGEIEDHLQLDTKVRCLCGNSLETESMIKVYLIFYTCSSLRMLGLQLILWTCNVIHSDLWVIT